MQIPDTALVIATNVPRREMLNIVFSQTDKFTIKNVHDSLGQQDIKVDRSTVSNFLVMLLKRGFIVDATVRSGSRRGRIETVYRLK